MKSRYYLGILIIILTVLGGWAGHQQNHLHNQVAVFHFPETYIDTHQPKKIIDAVKEQLVSEGAENITTIHNGDGTIILKYYSEKSIESLEADISTLAGIQLDKIGLDINHEPENNSRDNKELPEFDIYDIQSWHDFDSSMDRNAAIVVNSDFLRFSISTDPINLTYFSLDQTSYILHTRYNCQWDVVLQINITSNIIPEVRAGPYNYQGMLS